MNMNRLIILAHKLLMVFLVLGFVSIMDVQAGIDGLAGNTFDFSAREGYISMADGNSVYFWGYAAGNAPAQYPGPTLIINQGETVTIHLKNELPATAGPVSLTFPGHTATALNGVPGLMTQEAPPDGTTIVTYTFIAAHAGTYLYYSGTRPELQIEMGLAGAIIVRPYGYDHMQPAAYGHSDSRYDQEYLFFLSELDPHIHELVEAQGPSALAATTHLSNYFPYYWFINGRNAPDTMSMAGVPWLPSQPYNCMPMMHPGEKLLMRVIGAGRDLHPFHHHGNHARIIAVDGKLLQSTPAAGADLGQDVFTIQAVPGSTYDAIFEWTGEGLGWDIYGHKATDPLKPGEYAPDHGKPLPVALPQNQDLRVGAMYSGSPFLGTMGELPPGEGGFNPYAGYAYMWHSHTEKEMTNFNIFPGGMMTMLIIVPPGVPLEH